jgi:hypothetical protein
MGCHGRLRHKTRAVFDRYNIVNERDLRDAAQKLSRYLSAEFGHSSGIGSIQKRKPELGREANSFSDKEKDWLGDLDSNQDSPKTAGTVDSSLLSILRVSFSH